MIKRSSLIAMGVESETTAIFNALLKRGVSADRVSFLGKGESIPIVENSTELNRKKNRRVEIIFEKQ